MKTFVEFRSDKFPPYDDEEELINPGIWGKRLAEYLVEKLAEYGIETGELICEDWGWYIPIPDTRFSLALCVGHQGGGDDEFICFTEPGKPTGRRLFKKYDVTVQLTNLTGKLHTVLNSDQDIHGIEWSERG